MPSTELIERIDWWNCSPKLANSGLASEMRINSVAIHALNRLDNIDFKFVVTEESDIAEIKKDFASHVASDKIMLMPEGTTANRIAEKSSWLAELCIQHGFRFSPRLHILLWGNERGR